MPKEKIDSIDGSGFTVQVGWSGHSLQVATEVGGQTSIVRQLYGDPEKLERIGSRAVEAGWQPHTWPPGERPAGSTEQDRLRETGRRVLDVLEGPVSELTSYREDEYQGLWATLDRTGVNRLIRMLRKARDTAFGKDE